MLSPNYLPLFTGIFLNAISANLVKKRAEKLLPEPYTPLPDIIHQYTPKIPMIIPDIYLAICLYVTFLNCS